MTQNTNFLEFSKPFIEAAKNVFETMVFTKLEPKKPYIKNDTKSKGDISAVLGMTGELTNKAGEKVDFKGMLVISWPYDSYFKVASAMLMDTYTKYDDEIADVGGEISNMIMGNAKRDLATLGYQSNMSIPSMIEGAGHTIKYPSGTTVIVIPINSAHGEMFMELCYRDD